MMLTGRQLELRGKPTRTRITWLRVQQASAQSIVASYRPIYVVLIKQISIQTTAPLMARKQAKIQTVQTVQHTLPYITFTYYYSRKYILCKYISKCYITIFANTYAVHLWAHHSCVRCDLYVQREAAKHLCIPASEANMSSRTGGRQPLVQKGKYMAWQLRHHTKLNRSSIHRKWYLDERSQYGQEGGSMECSEFAKMRS